ncbi:MAG: VOC family protein [Acidimicrobiales bacterium]|jgi:catechol 2,3-dioxygenase-like lactoylglutathione lyase family enzyme|nr:VOC family protein [Acidimicrobiales bacterium]
MLAGREPIAFVHTVDLDRARRFYVDVLGLPVVAEDAFAVTVQAGPVTVRVTPVEAFTPSPHTVLGWSVPDVEETVAALAAAGVQLRHYEGMGQDDLGIWHGPDGTEVAWFDDPDGNSLSVAKL